MGNSLAANSNPRRDYGVDYDEYWSRPERVGQASLDVETVANHIVNACGLGRLLDIGCGEGGLVGALLKKGVDARGLDVSQVVVDRCNVHWPGRFFAGSILALPFPDSSFQTVVSTDCLEHVAPEDVPAALEEINRVAQRFVFLQIATTQDRDAHWHLTVEGRAWWEMRCFEAGFRKHPAYYKLNDYESLNRDPWQIYILLEKIPPLGLRDYPLRSLNEERGLHMDMTRETGERSDAHIIRYQWACNYIKTGDRVLDAACGLGYGAHVIRHLTHASRVVGLDGSDYAIDYARKSFSAADDRGEYRIGYLPDALSEYEDGSFEVIISFETLEHVSQPNVLLREFHRLLTPGGRVIVSVPNDWSDETGRDPNPFHLQVYTWHRLISELSAGFLLENAFAQTASQCKVAAKGGAWEHRERSLRPVQIANASPEDCEWWLMSAMKSPLETVQPYQERVFQNISSSGHPSVRYAESFNSPWLMHAIVNVGHRLKGAAALETVTDVVLKSSPASSNDYAAALCVKAYRLLEQLPIDASDIEDLRSCIDEVTHSPPTSPMQLRWKVSLLFVKGKLLQGAGRTDEAKAAFVACSRVDVRAFGIHLATKTTEALYLAGKIAFGLGQRSEAIVHWTSGVEYGQVLLDVSLDEVLISRTFPNRFNHGDGVREYALAWDNVARCANGLNLLRTGGDLNYQELESCFQTEYGVVSRDLTTARETLVERTRISERFQLELVELTRDLVATRKTLVERTAALERASADLVERTQDLVETRRLLVERTTLLEKIVRNAD